MFRNCIGILVCLVFFGYLFLFKGDKEDDDLL
jgi:hypothetical protein